METLLIILSGVGFGLGAFATVAVFELRNRVARLEYLIDIDRYSRPPLKWSMNNADRSEAEEQELLDRVNRLGAA